MDSFRMFGETKQVELDQGVVRYREMGEGHPIVFVHGILVNSVLWREVIPPLSQDFRCIALDLPLGAHRVPMNSDADLGPARVAQIVADFLEALDLQDVTLVGNDTGGAICQIVVSKHPERLARLILTNCDSYEAFFPALLELFLSGFSRLSDKAGYVAFTALHVPIYALFFWGLIGDGISRTLIFSLYVFFIVHVLLHLILYNHPENLFRSIFSYALIFGAGLLGAADLLFSPTIGGIIA